MDYFELSGVIDPVSAQALTRVITSSEASHSAVLIVRLDTPGGLRVPVTDLVVHGDDLVVSTQGRGFWVLDDVSPLRQTRAGTARYLTGLRGLVSQVQRFVAGEEVDAVRLARAHAQHILHEA